MGDRRRDCGLSVPITPSHLLPYPATSCSGCMPRTQHWTTSGNPPLTSCYLIILLHLINIHRLDALEPLVINSPTALWIGMVWSCTQKFLKYVFQNICCASTGGSSLMLALTYHRFHTSMFLLATFFTTAGNSSDAFFPLAIS